jgi:hypothetical protein
VTSAALASRLTRRRRIESEKPDKSVFHVPVTSIEPSPENDQLYQPVDVNDPEIVLLADSIRRHGVLEPLVVTLDDFILSGHRRYAAAKLAGLPDVPVRRKRIRRMDDVDEFVRLLREHNRQRPKTRDERLREELVTVDPHEAYESLIRHRREEAGLDVEQINLGDRRSRQAISEAKRPFLAAIIQILERMREFWPLSVRQIHYALLNDPPLKHASKPDSQYVNSLQSYKSADELTVRARLCGAIPFNAIEDETRPVVTFDVHREVGTFVGREMRRLLKGYWRDLMQSQPNHIELLVEKNTVAGIVKPIAGKYCIPMTSGRGFCSLPPRSKTADRFRRSGKSKLVLLIVSDFDPDGEQIAESFGRSMRDDFHIRDIVPVKVALTAQQVEDFELPENFDAKEGSANYERFIAKYGHSVYELEAISPRNLQRIITEGIDSVINKRAFNAELDTEKKDAAHLEGVRRKVAAVLQNMESASLAERVAKEFPADRWHPKLSFWHHAAVLGLKSSEQESLLAQCDEMVASGEWGVEHSLEDLRRAVSESASLGGA